jgi:hypothetical protein
MFSISKSIRSTADYRVVNVIKKLAGHHWADPATGSTFQGGTNNEV